MSFEYGRLAEIAYVGSSAAAVYTNPASTSFIRLIILFNGNTTAELVKLYNVPNSGGAAGTASEANQFYEESIGAKETIILDLPVPGLVLTDLNDTIQAETTTGSKVTVQIMGGQEDV